MRMKIAAILSVLLPVILFSYLPCQATDSNDLETIIASVKPGQPFVSLPCMTVAKVMNKDVMYQGNLGDIRIYAWVESGIVDSVFLTVKGRLCTTWPDTATKNLGTPTIDKSNPNGRVLRYITKDLEYYLVLMNKHENKDFLTDLTVFRRGSGHEGNELYHEDGDIWQSYFTSSQN